MDIIKTENGNIDIVVQNGDDFPYLYKNNLIRYLNSFDLIFNKAKGKSEYDFLLSLLSVKSLEGPGWDFFESTTNAIEKICILDREIEDFITSRHLGLWLYGHIVEASLPYELIMNLLMIVKGDNYNPLIFSPHRKGKPVYTEIKIDKISKRASELLLEENVRPFKEVWDRTLRNAIFHSRYSLFNGEIRYYSYSEGESAIRIPTSISNEDFEVLINKSLAYFHSIMFLRKIYIGSYKKPKIIFLPEYVTKDPEEKEAVVIVRKGYGAVGVKDNWSKQKIKEGKIPFRIGRFYPDEIKIMDNDSDINLLPSR